MDTGKILIVSFNKEEAKRIGKEVGSVGYPVIGVAGTKEETMRKLSEEAADLILLDGRFIVEKELLDLAIEIEEKFGVPYYLMLHPSSNSTPTPYTSLSTEGIIKEELDSRMIIRILQSFFSIRPMAGRKTIGAKKRRVSEGKDKIIGRSPKFLSALEMASQVAVTDASVLILGETGTGKEVFAKYIHEKSLRNKQKLLSLNCAAIPNELIESELFGHEKGSFTGAFEKKIGKFQLANRGSVFLDEIGELPITAQAKFLRFLQEKEIDVIGGTQTQHVDVRVIAATNRNLRQLVEDGKFRQDLYFRLTSFPIVIPPLRERKEDIDDLAYFFLERSSTRMNKLITEISPDTLNLFHQYDWPGNIRELENVIERGVILCTSKVLEMTPSDVHSHVSSSRVFNINIRRE